MADQLILVAIIVAGMVLYIGQWIPSEVTSMAILASLAISGLLGPEDVLSGFSNQATVTVAAMFVLSSGLLKTGALEAVALYISQYSFLLSCLSRRSRRRRSQMFC